jgi:hypothetical protein
MCDFGIWIPCSKLGGVKGIFTRSSPFACSARGICNTLMQEDLISDIPQSKFAILIIFRGNITQKGFVLINVYEIRVVC